MSFCPSFLGRSVVSFSSERTRRQLLHLPFFHLIHIILNQKRRAVCDFLARPAPASICKNIKSATLTSILLSPLLSCTNAIIHHYHGEIQTSIRYPVLEARSGLRLILTLAINSCRYVPCSFFDLVHSLRS